MSNKIHGYIAIVLDRAYSTPAELACMESVLPKIGKNIVPPRVRGDDKVMILEGDWELERLVIFSNLVATAFLRWGISSESAPEVQEVIFFKDNIATLEYMMGNTELWAECGYKDDFYSPLYDTIYRAVYGNAVADKWRKFAPPNKDGVVLDVKGGIERLYIDRRIWMDDSDHEKKNMQELVNMAKGGRILVAGLGLGIVHKMLLDREDITGITTIEINQDVIDLIKPRLHGLNIDYYNEDFNLWREWIGYIGGWDQFSCAIVDIWQRKHEAIQYQEIPIPVITWGK